MRIQATQTHKGFTSLNNPITPFVMNTKKGDVLISEIPAFYLRDEKILKTYSTIFCKKFCITHQRPILVRLSSSTEPKKHDSFVC